MSRDHENKHIRQALEKINTQNWNFDVYQSKRQRTVRNRSFGNQLLNGFEGWFLSSSELSKTVFDSFRKSVTNNNTIPLSLYAIELKLTNLGDASDIDYYINPYKYMYPYKHTMTEEMLILNKFYSEYLFEYDTGRATDAIGEFVNAIVLFVKSKDLYEREAVLDYLRNGMLDSEEQNSQNSRDFFRSIKGSVSRIQDALIEKLESIKKGALDDRATDRTFDQWFEQTYRDLNFNFIDATFSPELTTRQSTQEKLLTVANQEFINTTDLNQLNMTVGHYQPNNLTTERYQPNTPTISSDSLTVVLPLLFAATGIGVFVLILLLSIYVYKKYKSDNSRDDKGASLLTTEIDMNTLYLKPESVSVYDGDNFQECKKTIEEAYKNFQHYYNLWGSLGSGLTLEEKDHFNSLIFSLKESTEKLCTEKLCEDKISTHEAEASLGRLCDLLAESNLSSSSEVSVTLGQLSSDLLSKLNSCLNISYSPEDEQDLGTGIVMTDNQHSIFHQNRDSTDHSNNDTSVTESLVRNEHEVTSRTYAS